MTYYSTTLLPPSPPYTSIDSIISVLCDRCIKEQEDDSIQPHVKQQLFEYTLMIVEFWYKEEENLGLKK
jgi:hypothetical protein